MYARDAVALMRALQSSSEALALSTQYRLYRLTPAGTSVVGR